MSGDGPVTLTVMYNLRPGVDEGAFLRWRLGDHQAANAAAPGVLETTFEVAGDTPMGPPAYRYVTRAVFASRAALDAAFFTPEARASFLHDTRDLCDVVVLVGATLARSGGPTG